MARVSSACVFSFSRMFFFQQRSCAETCRRRRRRCPECCEKSPPRVRKAAKRGPVTSEAPERWDRHLLHHRLLCPWLDKRSEFLCWRSPRPGSAVGARGVAGGLFHLCCPRTAGLDADPPQTTSSFGAKGSVTRASGVVVPGAGSDHGRRGTRSPEPC